MLLYCIGVNVQTDIAELKKSVPHIIVGRSYMSLFKFFIQLR